MWSICQNDTRYCALTGDDTSLKKIFELKEKVSCIQLTNRQALKSNNRLFALSSFSCAKGRARLCHVLDCAVRFALEAPDIDIAVQPTAKA